MDGVTFPEIVAGVRREIAALEAEIAATKAAGAGEWRTPSRYVEDGADEDVVRDVAAGKARLAPGGPADFTGVRKGDLALGLKALAEGTAGSGGYLVQPQVASDVLTLVRARSVVQRMGVTVIPGIRKELDLTAIATGATAYYTAENAAIPTSEETFTQRALLKPMDLDALVPISLRLLRDAAQNPNVEDVIRRDLAEVIALRADLAFLQGTGTGEPLGIKNTSGLTPAPNLGANGGTPSYDHLMDMVGAVREANGPFASPGWVFRPRTLNTLEKVKDLQDRYLAESGLLTIDSAGASGTLLGYPFRTSTQIPNNLTVGTSTDCSYIIFSSDWNEAYIGEEQSLVIDVSGDAAYTPDGGTTWVSAFQNKQALFRAVTTHDFTLRRPAFFSVLTGVRP